jgi:hypothetical protein
MYVHGTVAHLHDNCCHESTTIQSLFIVAGVDVNVNNMKVFNVMEMQQWVPFALSSYKILHTAVNNNKY